MHLYSYTNLIIFLACGWPVCGMLGIRIGVRHEGHRAEDEHLEDISAEISSRWDKWLHDTGRHVLGDEPPPRAAAQLPALAARYGVTRTGTGWGPAMRAPSRLVTTAGDIGPVFLPEGTARVPVTPQPSRWPDQDTLRGVTGTGELRALTDDYIASLEASEGMARARMEAEDAAYRKALTA